MSTQTLNFGKIAYSSKNIANKVEISLELKTIDNAIDYETLNPVKNVPVLSISGGIWNSRQSDYETCGQCLDTIQKYLPKNGKIAKIVELWKGYHLNDMKAGTKKQTQYLNGLESEGWKYSYSGACYKLKAANLYMDNGYKYGSKWLYKPIPKNVLAEIKELLN